MKAAWYEATGPAAEVIRIGEIDDPVAGPGEVVVRVQVHGVNPTDWKRRSGQRGPLKVARMIPGYDAAGVIESVGAGVNPTRIGERVWVWEAAHLKWDGAAARRVRVAETRALPLPATASFEEGASLGVPVMTACHALLLGGPVGGETVIVTGAGGVVGNYAVQEAKRMGAAVLATVRGKDTRETEIRRADAFRAGADHVVAPEELEESALDLTGGKGARTMVDVDLGAHLGRAWRYVAENGTIASFGSASDPKPVLDWPRYMYRNIRICGVAIFEIPEEAKRRAARVVQEALDADALFHRVDRVFPLDELAAAHDHQQYGRPRGKVLVTTA